MKSTPSVFRSFTWLLALSFLSLTFAARAQETAPEAAPALIDSNFDKTEGVEWPAGWPRVKESQWEEEEGNGYLRLQSVEADKTIMLYREIHLPAGTEALQLSWKQRVTNLKRGSNSWYDARIMLEFMDAGRGKVGPSPSAPNRNRDTAGWEERSITFNVPPNAKILKFMPALFRVTSGTFDLDDVVLRPVPRLAPKDDPAEQRKVKAEAAVEARRAKAAQAFATHGDLILNGDFQSRSKSDGPPDHWGAASGAIQYPSEEGNTFLRITSTQPDEMAILYRKMDLPPGVRALELRWKWRTTDLKPGAQPWFDARFMLKVQDAAGNNVGPQPAAPYTRKSTGVWEERSLQFLVDEKAAVLEFMPALFRVKSGVLDIDDLSLKPIDAEALMAGNAEKEAQRARMQVPVETPDPGKWPAELKVVGNRLHNPDGQEVWLQGVNIASLEWNPRGESVMMSAKVALEQWKANVIRLPVKEEYWFGSGGAEYQKVIDDFITFTANRGAYVVLDLHRYRAPRKEHLDFWKDAAVRYKNHPAVLFDLINEPHGTSWEVWRNGGFVQEKKDMADEDAFLTDEEKVKNAMGFMSIGMQALVDGVRETGARNIVVVGGLDWAYDLSGILTGYAIVDHPDANGVMYATHVYPWKKGWQKKFLDVAEKHPILVGEVGADANKMNWMPLDQQEDWETWVPDMIALIQSRRLNWTAWCFHPKASPRMLLDWDYTPTPFWGEQVKAAFSGKVFPNANKLR